MYKERLNPSERGMIQVAPGERPPGYRERRFTSSPSPDERKASDLPALTDSDVDFLRDIQSRINIDTE